MTATERPAPAVILNLSTSQTFMDLLPRAAARVHNLLHEPVADDDHADENIKHRAGLVAREALLCVEVSALDGVKMETVSIRGTPPHFLLALVRALDAVGLKVIS